MEKLKVIDENNIIFDGVKLKAVDCKSCDECVFWAQGKCYFDEGALTEDGKKFNCSLRKDRRSVIWVRDEYTPEPYDEAIAKAKEELKNYLPENEKKLPKTWEEYCEIVEGEEFYFTSNKSKVFLSIRYNTLEVNDDKNLLPSKELAEAMLALCQLLQLRECYNDGWKPVWGERTEEKYCIAIQRDEIKIFNGVVLNKILAFRTKELRDEFLNNFRDLIEIAKPLL